MASPRASPAGTLAADVAADVEMLDVQTDATPSPPGSPSMVKARARRANAGNRMRKLIEQEESQQQSSAAAGEDGDEIAVAWQETADDEEFGGAEAEDAGDISLESSGDEDDGEGSQEGDDFAGERELERVERAQKRKKRKMGLMEQAKARLAKRPRTAKPVARSSAAGTTDGTPQPDGSRLKKKIERVSWLADGPLAPTRTSKRGATVESRKELHQRLQQKEKHRLRTVAIMEAAEKRKKTKDHEPLTQAQRLEEAKKIERFNSKSLNRWEESERIRQEEQRRRLEELKGKKIKGPFFAWWSSRGIWVDGKIRYTGGNKTVEEVEELYEKARKENVDPVATKSPTNAPTGDERPDQDAKPSEVSQAQEPHPLQPPAEPASTDPTKLEEQSILPEVSGGAQPLKSTEKSNLEESTKPDGNVETTEPSKSIEISKATDIGASKATAEITDSPKQVELNKTTELPEPNKTSESLVPSQDVPSVQLPQSSKASEPAATGTSTSSTPAQEQAHKLPTAYPSSILFAPPETSVGLLAGIDHYAPDQQRPAPAPNPQPELQTSASGSASDQLDRDLNTILADPQATPAELPKPTIEQSVRNLVTLSQFTSAQLPAAASGRGAAAISATVAAREALSRALFHWDNGSTTTSKAPPKTLCAITANVAKYRDPLTGLPYADKDAYRMIRRMLKGDFAWSTLLGAYVGKRGIEKAQIKDEAPGSPGVATDAKAAQPQPPTTAA